MAKTSRRTGSSGAPSRAMSTRAAAPAKPAAAPVTAKAPVYPAPPPAAARSAAPVTKPATAPAASAASAQHAPQTQQQHYAPPPAAAPASQGPGMMATIAANAASIAAGHVVAKSVDRMIWGSGTGSSAEGDAASAPEAAAPQASQQVYQQGPTQQYIANACNFEVQEFQKCIQTNSNDSSACQMYFDMLTQCQKNAQENAKY